ncbi:MAG: thymidine phosphorylase, partial [Candidatus Paceibacteria bacterium]
ELGDWTRSMLNSGRVVTFDGLDRPTSDKHSTGGVGDKVSIPLAPAVAACGVAVPMISGRGLGHTGGTLDKLESIPGFSTELSEEQFQAAIRQVGVALAGQTADLVPADRKLYALRDVTGLVSSIPLIASSIMSKKLAEGAQSLVLDIKFGSGAIVPEVARGKRLAQAMMAIGANMGVPMRVLQTAMDRPLGAAVGHTLEVIESLACLAGEGPADLRELVCEQGAEMLLLAGIESDIREASTRIAASLDSGTAMAKFEELCLQQGARPGKWFNAEGDPNKTDRDEWVAPHAGCLRHEDVREIGLALVDLGGGRVRLNDRIDPGVGFRFHVDAGAQVEAGQPICTIHHRAGRGLQEAKTRLSRAITVGASFQPEPLILARL